MENPVEIIEQLNDKLKTIKTWEEFQDFEKEMDSYEIGLILKGKRRDIQAYHFTHMYEDKRRDGEYTSYAQTPEFLNRVQYLYADSVSTGQADIKNLYRVLKVSQ